MDEVLLGLLSGLIGAIVGSVIVILYSEFVRRKNRQVELAKEKLEKLYGPLMFFIQRSEQKGQKDELLHTDTEGKLLDEISLKYYYLADNDLRERLHLINSFFRYQESTRQHKDSLLKSIKDGYSKYKQIIGDSDTRI